MYQLKILPQAQKDLDELQGKIFNKIKENEIKYNDKCEKANCLGRYLKYYFLRQTWNGKGGYDVYIYSRP